LTANAPENGWCEDDGWKIIQVVTRMHPASKVYWDVQKFVNGYIVNGI